MIVFNGVSIDSVAPVKIDDIKISPISYSPVVRARPLRFGAEFVRMGGGERVVTVTFALLDMDMNTRHESVLNISKWARSDAEFMLELPMDNIKALFCVCTAKPEPSTRVWWENKLKLSFTCFNNPYWTSKAQRVVACGTQFTTFGDAPPLMEIRRTLSSSASNQSYSDGTNTMTFSTIPAGEMVIDVNRQTAVVGTSSIMQNYKPSSNFILPKVGTQTITGTGNVYIRERWE